MMDLPGARDLRRWAWLDWNPEEFPLGDGPTGVVEPVERNKCAVFVRSGRRRYSIYGLLYSARPQGHENTTLNHGH